MKLLIHEDGSWDLTGTHYQVIRMAPVLDGIRVMPLHVKREADAVFYELEDISMSVFFDKTDKQIVLRCHMEKCDRALHDLTFEGQFQTKMTDDLRVYVQGLGMEGPSGTYNLGSGVENSVPVSHGLMAFHDGRYGLNAFAVSHLDYDNCYQIRRTKSIFGSEYLSLSMGFNLEGVPLKSKELPAIFIRETEGTELREDLASCAVKIADHMNARHVHPPAFFWSSWYYQYQNMCQELLEEYIQGFNRYPCGFRYIQLDAGYCPSLGDWLLPGHLFPCGLEKAADEIKKAGYLPGIWIGPFMVGDRSALYRDHPEWILKGTDGRPVIRMTSYNEPKAWGNPDCNYYILDASHPGAMDYLRTVFETLYRWGFRLFKTDFMLWNMYDSSRVTRFNPEMTSVQILRSVLKMIREVIGEDSFLLGCIAPFLPFIGYADGMRIAGDVGAQWEGCYGPANMLRELTADNYFNQVYWQNDPDAVLLRDFDIHLNQEERRSLALLQALSGGIVTTSDPVHQMTEETRRFLSFIHPDASHRPVIPEHRREDSCIILLHHLRQGKLLYVLNPSDHPVSFACRFQDYFTDKYWYVRPDTHLKKPDPDPELLISDGKNNKKEYWMKDLEAHESLLLYLSQSPLEQEPDNLWIW